MVIHYDVVMLSCNLDLQVNGRTTIFYEVKMVPCSVCNVTGDNDPSLQVSVRVAL
jgi:hypothetical protein